MDQKTTTNINSVAANTVAEKILIIKEENSYLKTPEGDLLRTFKTEDLLWIFKTEDLRKRSREEFGSEFVIIRIQPRTILRLQDKYPTILGRRPKIINYSDLARNIRPEDLWGMLGGDFLYALFYS